MALFKVFNFTVAVIVAAIAYVIYLPYPPSRKLEGLSERQGRWHSQGKMMLVNGYNMFYRYEKLQPRSPTLVLIHGFPSSSFDYHKAHEELVRLYKNVLVFDHVGYGFSDKPATGFSYSCVEHADQMLSLLRLLGVREAHFVAHDMGDSVLTEVLTRRRLRLLPAFFDTTFKSVTFTNGGMMVKNIGFRLSQRLLLLPYLGKWLSHALVKLQVKEFSRRQLASIWGNSSGALTREQDIEDLIHLNELQGGTLLMHKMIHYLRDRFVFEERWLKSVTELDVPCRLVWGDNDAVSPPKMAHDLHAVAPNCKLSFLRDVGHFLMLESPHDWVQSLDLP